MCSSDLTTVAKAPRRAVVARRPVAPEPLTHKSAAKKSTRSAAKKVAVKAPAALPSRKAQSGPRRRKLDPFLAREAERYEDPLPSREFLLQVLAEEGLPLEEQALARLVGIKKHELDSFARRLGAMERDGQLLRNRKGALLVAEKLDLVAGHIEIGRAHV